MANPDAKVGNPITANMPSEQIIAQQAAAPEVMTAGSSSVEEVQPVCSSLPVLFSLLCQPYFLIVYPARGAERRHRGEGKQSSVLTLCEIETRRTDEHLRRRGRHARWRIRFLQLLRLWVQ